jgi:hypothetical protein
MTDTKKEAEAVFDELRTVSNTAAEKMGDAFGESLAKVAAKAYSLGRAEIVAKVRGVVDQLNGEIGELKASADWNNCDAQKAMKLNMVAHNLTAIIEDSK